MRDRAVEFDAYIKNRGALKASILALVLLLSISAFITFAHAQSPTETLGIGAEIGIWRPNDLGNDVTLSFVMKTKDHPYLGFVVMKPLRYGLTFRASPGYWKYCDNSTTGETRAIEILSVLADLKYALLSDVRLLPYVSYGIGWFLGRKKYEDDAHFRFNEAATSGIGVNVGTGFDFKLAAKLYSALEFRYHYLKFHKAIASTNNYSGAKISLALFYLF